MRHQAGGGVLSGPKPKISKSSKGSKTVSVWVPNGSRDRKRVYLAPGSVASRYNSLLKIFGQFENFVVGSLRGHFGRLRVV